MSCENAGKCHSFADLGGGRSRPGGDPNAASLHLYGICVEFFNPLPDEAI